MDERQYAERESRRGFVKRAAYVAPAILTLAVAPEYAKAGSPKVVGCKEPRASDKKSRCYLPAR